MVKESINHINISMQNIINKKIIEIVQNIKGDYNINFDLNNYNDNTKLITQNSIIELINDLLRCQAKVKSGCQCKRSKKNNTNFCKIHQKKQKFGMISYKHILNNL
jgi:hypothetical protein